MYKDMYNKKQIMHNAWNLKKEVKIGYVDNMTGDFVVA